MLETTVINPLREGLALAADSRAVRDGHFRRVGRPDAPQARARAL